jgi:hypothetical protein
MNTPLLLTPRRSLAAFLLLGGFAALAHDGPASPFEHSPNASHSDPHPNLYPEPDFITDGGVGYQWTIELGAEDTAYFTGHVGAWSWEDEALFDPAAGEEPVGWTHTSHWAFVTLKEAAWLTVQHEAAAGIPWPAADNPARLASTKTMGPSFTLYAGYQADGPDGHTYNNRGPVAWAPDLTYLAHVDNPAPRAAEGVWRLPAGRYTLALGSNAPSNDSDRQGYFTRLSSSATEPAPTLRMARQGGGLTLFWRQGLAGYVLESAADAAFADPVAEATLAADAGALDFAFTGEAKYFRLRKPSPPTKP